MKLEKFTRGQIKVVNDAVAMAEELVSNSYKMSQNQWLAKRYDIKILDELTDNEIVQGPFAQIIKYEGQKKDTSLGSAVYDFYKICLQDNTILSVLKQPPGMKLFPFVLYIIIHELIHIVRFSSFLQNFDASNDEKMEEELLVHGKTHEILKPVHISGLKDVLSFYKRWCPSFFEHLTT